METPKQMSLAESLAQVSKFLMLHCAREGKNELKCVHCGGDIRRVRAFMSLHDERFGKSCIGPGRAWRMEIPYCIACEKTPSMYGCIHMNETELNLPSVIEASRPFGSEHPKYR